MFSSECIEGKFSCTGESCAGVECNVDEFQCLDREKCIPTRFICDRVNDCKDGSDENNCSKCLCFYFNGFLDNL